MYDELKKQNKNRGDVKDFVLFDEDNQTVWIMWYEGV